MAETKTEQKGSEPQKEGQHSSQQQGQGGGAKTVLPEGMTYPTPELDPQTGAPLDTRFQSDTSQEAAASQRSPKSEAQRDEAQRAGSQQADRPQAQRQQKDEDDDEDSDKAKNKEKPKSRR